MKLWRDALQRHPDPVDAWQSIVEDLKKAQSYKSQRGKGGLVRISWDEANQIAAAAHVYTLKRYGPDRLAAFTVIPAMSQVLYGAGTRFYSLLGWGHLVLLRLVRRPADGLPQVFGDQTDVPAESGDWYNASYLMM